MRTTAYRRYGWMLVTIFYVLMLAALIAAIAIGSIAAFGAATMIIAYANFAARYAHPNFYLKRFRR